MTGDISLSVSVAPPAPLTRLANEIIKLALANSIGWQLASQSLESPAPQPVTCEGE